MNFRPWMLSPVIVMLLTWGVATTSPRARDMLAENGLLSPATSDPWIILPATDAMGLGIFNVIILAGISTLLAAVVWAWPELSFIWDEPTSVDPGELYPVSGPGISVPNAPESSQGTWEKEEITPLGEHTTDSDNKAVD